MTFPFSLQPSPYDPRDREYCFVPRAAPKYFHDLTPMVGHKHFQGSLGACVGNGGTAMFEALAYAKGVPLHLSRKFLHEATQVHEGRLGEEGVFPRNMFKVAKNIGVPLEDGPLGYPYDLSIPPQQPPAWAYAEAAKMKLRRYEAIVAPHEPILSRYTASEIVYRIKSALAEGLVVGVGMYVTESLRHLTGPWRQHDYKIVDANNPPIGGHWVDLVANDNSVGKFKALNWHGTEAAPLGDDGYVGLPYEICGDNMFEAWVARDFNGWSVPEMPGVLYEGMSRYEINMRIVPEAHEVGQTKNIWIAAQGTGGKWYLMDSHGIFRAVALCAIGLP